MNKPFCEQCSGFLRIHPENCMKRIWLKCGTCGFTRKLQPMKNIITLPMYWMGRDIAYPNDLTDEIKQNAAQLLQQINLLLTELNISKVKVSSGWRPPAINAKIANAAKASLHQIGKACDIKDNDNQDLGKLIASKPELLKKFNLWQEDLESTKGWTHLDIGTRVDRPSRMFKP